jgi:putrescine aminotransferase
MIIAPPLTMTRTDIDEMMRLIRLALDLTQQELRQKGLI